MPQKPNQNRPIIWIAEAANQVARYFDSTD